MALIKFVIIGSEQILNHIEEKINYSPIFITKEAVVGNGSMENLINTGIHTIIKLKAEHNLYQSRKSLIEKELTTIVLLATPGQGELTSYYRTYDEKIDILRAICGPIQLVVIIIDTLMNLQSTAALKFEDTQFHKGRSIFIFLLPIPNENDVMIWNEIG